MEHVVRKQKGDSRTERKWEGKGNELEQSVMAHTDENVTIKPIFCMLTYFFLFLKEKEAAGTVATSLGFPVYRILSQSHLCQLSSLRHHVTVTELQHGLKLEIHVFKR